MSADRFPYVLEADVRIAPDTDPAALGAAVTTALCGHWEHEGPCRWPHNNAVSDDHASFRTVFVAPADEEAEVRMRIEDGLRTRAGWELLETLTRPVLPGEEPLAQRLATTPRLSK